MLKHLICMLTRHRINRHRVWDDGMDFRTNCSRCGVAMIRTANGWRRFDETRHSDPRREERRQQR